MQKLSTLLIASGLLLLPSSLKAAVDFQAPVLSIDQDTPQFPAPFIISSSEGLTSFQFTVSWDPGVLSLVQLTDSVTKNPSFPGTIGFGAGAGGVSINWSSGTPLTGWTENQPAFYINFIPEGQAGTSTPLQFDDTITSIQITINAVETTEFTLSPGSVTVVPEPINVALGTFAGLVLCVGAVRKYRNRQSA